MEKAGSWPGSWRLGGGGGGEKAGPALKASSRLGGGGGGCEGSGDAMASS
jgi:hypothetical protein